MTDPEDLLPAILTAPDDDLPRLVYADALEETGEPGNITRAEFIRVQIELAKNPGRLDLVAREAALRAIHGESWLAASSQEKVKHSSSQSTHGQFRRGFVEVVWMQAAIFVQRAAKLFENDPVVELRVLKSNSREFSLLLECPELSRIQTLDLSDRKIGDRGIACLHSSKFLTRMNGLRLRACNLTNSGFRLLLIGKFPSPLNELDVSLNDISQSEVATLKARFGDQVVRFDPLPPTDSIPARPDR